MVTYDNAVLSMAREVVDRCLGETCTRCMAECPMMKDFGPYPGEILRSLTERGSLDPLLAYSCNHCGNCTLVCPRDLPMGELFLEARKDIAAANHGFSPMPGHRTVDFHQFFGFSKPFTAKVPPVSSFEGKRVAFMAGCSLSSSSPEEVQRTLEWLRTRIPGTGAIQKCCGLPTSDMGQEALFEKRTASVQQDLNDMGVDELIVACQNCKTILDRYGTTPTRSLWEVLPEIGIPEECRGKGKDSDIVFTIHDSCPTRGDKAIQDGIRWLMEELGYRVVEADASREKTRCCGAGGMVAHANPAARDEAVRMRLDSLPSENIVVYCGTCRSTLASGGGRVWHILDLLFGPVVHAGDEPPENVLASTRKAWTNRYLCKHAVETAKESIANTQWK